MDRINLNNSAYYCILSKLDLRPSTKDQLKESLRLQGIWSIKDLCMTAREVLLLLPYFDEDIVKVIESELLHYGLRLGMTQHDIYDYMDAEYLKRKYEGLDSAVSRDNTNTSPPDDHKIVSESDNQEEEAIAGNTSSGDKKDYSEHYRHSGRVERLFLFILGLVSGIYLQFVIRFIASLDTHYSVEPSHIEQRMEERFHEFNDTGSLNDIHPLNDDITEAEKKLDEVFD